jgi:PAS domain S-box-containing protein
LSLEEIHRIYGNIRVLHIDDEELQLNLVKENIEYLNKEIVIESEQSLEKALENKKTDSYDCVLMDLIMPITDGIDGACKIREFSDVPIILYTQKESESITEKAFHSGISDFLTKKSGLNHFKILHEKIRYLTKKYRNSEIYDEIISSLSDSIVIIDENSKIVFYNDNFSDLVKDKQITGKNLLHYVEENSYKLIEDFIKKDNVEKNIQTIIKDKYGAPIFIEFEKSNVSYKLRSFNLIKIKDITNIIEENNFNSKGQEKFLAYAKLSPNAIMVANIYGYITYINSAYTKLTGYTRDEIVGRHFLKLQVMQGRDIKPYWNLIKQVMSGKLNNMSTEFAFTRKDGTSGVGDAFISHYKSEGKREMLAIIRDRTNIKKREEEFQNIFNTSPEGIIHLDLDGVIKNINLSAKNILDINNEEIEGHNILEMTRLGLIDETNIDLINSSILSGKQTEPYELKLKNNKILEINASLIKIVNENLGIQVSIRDITEKKQSEIKKENYTSELEQAVQERTNQILDNEKMVTLAKVSSMIAHDLKGPLQVMSNSLYLMKAKPEETEKYINYINAALNQANSLINEMSERSTSGKLIMRPYNLEELVDESIVQAKVTENINLQTDIPSNLVINIDGMKIKRVINNIIKNSIEAMPDGGDIILSAKTNDKNVCISIRDTGKGISENKLKNIFRPFQSTKSQGMGIGLIFCKNTVEAHGGTISVESKEGEGTTFLISLPLEYKVLTHLIG